MFLALEGGDGAGKTTQRDLLASWLTAQQRDVVVTREPGGTRLGRTLRSLVLDGEDLDPRTEALLFAADRAHHVHTLVRPALLAGKDVITDRYIDSSVAYQGAGRDLGVREIRRLSQWATDRLHPDLTIVLDLDPAIAARRRDGPQDRLERETLEFHHRVRTFFLEQAAAQPHRYVVIDASLGVDRVHELVRANVAVLLQRRVDPAA